MLASGVRWSTSCLLKSDWTNCWRLDVNCSDASEKMFLCDAHSTRFSRRVMVVCWSVLIFAVRPTVNVPRKTLSNNWSLPTWRLEMSFLTWSMEGLQVFQKSEPSCFLQTLGVLTIIVISCGTTPFSYSERGPRFQQCNLLAKDIGMCVYFCCPTIWHQF